MCIAGFFICLQEYAANVRIGVDSAACIIKTLCLLVAEFCTCFRIVSRGGIRKCKVYCTPSNKKKSKIKEEAVDYVIKKGSWPFLSAPSSAACACADVSPSSSPPGVHVWNMQRAATSTES